MGSVRLTVVSPKCCACRDWKRCSLNIDSVLVGRFNSDKSLMSE